MIPVSAAEIARIVGGRLVHGAETGAGAAGPVSGAVRTDSRTVRAGDVFVAMRGEVTDGARFVTAAAEAGAALVIAEAEQRIPVQQIIVPDAAAALADLARESVERLRRDGLRVVGITGSNGKTTTKNLLAHVLAGSGATIAPEGSFNNHVGMPVTMLRADRDTRYLVLEMGAGRPGDIARLVGMVVPDIAVELKVGLAHAGMYSGPDAVRAEKAELVRVLPAGAVAILNTDDPLVETMAAETAARIVRIGRSARADLRATGVRVGADGTDFVLEADGERREVHLAILGEHQVGNALAALAVAFELGVDPDRAIERIGEVRRAERWRMEVLERRDGVTVVNDAYNASPDSTAAALKTLAELGSAGRRTIAVLGEMAELGELSAEEHDRIGRLAVRLDIAQLVVVGEVARPIHQGAGLEGSWDGESIWVADPAAAYDVLDELVQPGDVVLVKSSKSAELRFLGDRLAGVEGAPS